MVIGEVSLSASEVFSFLTGGLLFGGAAVGVYDKRRRELTDTYKELYEAKSDKVDELEKEVRDLRAQVDLLMSEFTTRLAAGVTDAIVRINGDHHG